MLIAFSGLQAEKEPGIGESGSRIGNHVLVTDRGMAPGSLVPTADAHVLPPPLSSLLDRPHTVPLIGILPSYLHHRGDDIRPVPRHVQEYGIRQESSDKRDVVQMTGRLLDPCRRTLAAGGRVQNRGEPAHA